MKTFDLANVLFTPTFLLGVRLASGKPSGWEIELMGPGHPRMDALNAELRRFQAEQKLEKQQAERKNRPYVEDEEATKAFFEAWFAKRLIGWSPVRFNGEDFLPTEENKQKIFSAAAFGFVRDQIHEAWKADEDFLPKPPKDSDPSPEPAFASTNLNPTENHSELT